MKKAVVLFSGGQDSTVCLFQAMQDCEQVFPLVIKYGQRHQERENQAVHSIYDLITERDLHSGVTHLTFPYFLYTSLLSTVSSSALLDEVGDVNATRKEVDLPASFVPGRNILFLTIAGMYAYKHKCSRIYIGANQVDYSGYPDCRFEFLSAMALALCHGMEHQLSIRTPLLYLTKAQIVKKASLIPGCMEAMKFTHTCYNGKFPPCMQCNACKIRAKGFEEAGVEDPLLSRV